MKFALRKYLTKRSSLFVYLVLLSFGASAIDLTKENMAWMYNPDFVARVQHRVVRSDDTMTVWVSFSVPQVRGWDVNFIKQNKLTSQDHTTVDLNSVDTLRLNGNEVFFEIKMNFINKKEYLVLQFGKGKSFYYPILLDMSQLPFLYPVDGVGQPILSNYFSNPSLHWKGQDSLYIGQFSDDFDVANSPMDVEKTSLLPLVEADTTYKIFSEIQCSNWELYRMTENLYSSKQVSLLKVPAFYPKKKTMDGLVASLEYLLYPQEKNNFIEATNKKKVFDNFWLTLYQSPLKAKNAIRNYYQWVSQANELFTTHKEGWKTDRGMIFIIFGPPDNVHIDNSSEEWHYSSSKVTFDFSIVSSFFSDKTYILHRDIKYREVWEKHIKAIRKDI